MKHTWDNKQSAHYFLICLLLMAFAFRVYHLGTQPLTGDEAFSMVTWIHSSLNELLTTVTAIDPQPPAALLTFYAWIRLVGETEIAARMLSALAGTFTVALTYTLTHRLANNKTALIAALLCSTNPFLLWHSQDLRTYSLWIVLSVASTYTLLIASERQAKFLPWTIYITTTIASLYMFYLQAFVIVAHNIYLAYKTYRNHTLITPWFLSQITIVAAFAPWALQPTVRNATYQPTAAMPDISAALQTFALGDTFPGTTTFTQAITVTLILGAFILLWLTPRRKAAVLLTAHTIVPIALLTTLALITNKGYFRPRYIAASTVPIIIVFSCLIFAIISSRRIPRHMRQPATLIVLAIVFTSILSSLTHYYFDPAYAKAPNWRDIVQTLQQETTTQDLLIFNYPDPALTYYFKGPAQVIVLPTAPNPIQEQSNRTIEQLLDKYAYLWFIPVYVQSWDTQQTIASALNSQAQPISNQWIGKTNLYQYASWNVQPDQITNPLHTTLSDLVELVGYRTTPPISLWQPETTLNIEVFWKPLQPTTTNLTIFFHVLGPTQSSGSPLWAQDDYPPQDGHTSTTTWIPGSLIRDTYTLTLPPQAPSGTYTITLGYYDPITTIRYPISTDNQAEPDSVTLLTFSLP